MPNTPLFIINKTYDEINIGDEAALTRTLTKEAIQLFAYATGDMNPASLDEGYAKTDTFHRIIGPRMWAASMIPVLLGIHLPGPGTIYLSQSLEFLLPVHLNDIITASIKVIEKGDSNKYVTFESLCVNDKGQQVLKGESVVSAPSETISWNAVPLVEFQIKT